MLIPRTTAALVALILACGLVSARIGAQSPAEKWVATWTTATVGRPQVAPPAAPVLPPFMPLTCPAASTPAAVSPSGQEFPPSAFAHFSNQTLRQIVHTTLGGSRVRVVVTNARGTTPLTIGGASVALREKDSLIQAASARPLSFSGRSAIAIPAGAVAYSDPVSLDVPAMSDVAVDLYLSGTTDTPSPVTIHNLSAQTNYFTQAGNHVGHASIPVAGGMQNWFFLSRVEVLAAAATPVIVAFGDSITDGTRSTPNSNNRWTDQLVRRAMMEATPRRLAIANTGIAGNRVLSDAGFAVGVNALARFDTDVLAQPGVTHVVILEGINDIGFARQDAAPTADDIIAGHKQLIDRARAKGISVIGATLTPFWGGNNYTDVGEKKRQAVNQWIRTSGAYDAVVDFDKATQDPADPRKLRADFDSCDHLHPNDAGYRAMAAAIDLRMFMPRSK